MRRSISKRFQYYWNRDGKILCGRHVPKSRSELWRLEKWARISDEDRREYTYVSPYEFDCGECGNEQATEFMEGERALGRSHDESTESTWTRERTVSGWEVLDPKRRVVATIADPRNERADIAALVAATLDPCATGGDVRGKLRQIVHALDYEIGRANAALAEAEACKPQVYEAFRDTKANDSKCKDTSGGHGARHPNAIGDLHGLPFQGNLDEIKKADVRLRSLRARRRAIQETGVAWKSFDKDEPF